MATAIEATYIQNKSKLQQPEKSTNVIVIFVLTEKLDSSYSIFEFSTCSVIRAKVK